MIDREQQSACEAAATHGRISRAYILNLAIPKTIEQVYSRATADDSSERGRFDIEGILYGDPCSGWTAPKWAQVDDLVFFMLTRTSAYAARRLAKDWLEERDFYAPEEVNLIEQMLLKAQWLADRYSGKIYAVGRIASEPEYALPVADLPHFRKRLFADVDEITLLEKPVDMEEFKSYISISRTGSITTIEESALAQLSDLLTSAGNCLPDYVFKTR